RARTVGVGVQADAGLLLLAVATTPTRDVERHRDEVALLDELHVAPGLDHLAGDLVPQDQPFGSGRAPADHVLVGAADVGRDDLEDHPVLGLAPDVVGVDSGSVPQLELREVDRLDLDLAGAHVGDTSVVRHVSPSCWLPTNGGFAAARAGNGTVGQRTPAWANAPGDRVP